eukprot:TRINITY_DN61_c0_g1_i2.p1 TRINITY_DN61_c0_g1~~TRINITY_DN61_c0_g1_i2.p1  ORF type:complete len:269 (-),score=58.17 TRINITY_DN61_c0_g1_i2:387-1193(-)
MGLYVKNTFVESLEELDYRHGSGSSGLGRQQSAPAILSSEMQPTAVADETRRTLETCGERCKQRVSWADHVAEEKVEISAAVEAVAPSPTVLEERRFPPRWKAGSTTIMMRNLPNKYTQGVLLRDIRDQGFKAHEHFDFFYLPIDRKNGANLGYAFMNFCTEDFAIAFAQALQGRQLRRYQSRKVIEVTPASVQGYDANMKFYSTTRVAQCRDLSCRPLFFHEATHAIFAAEALRCCDDWQAVGQHTYAAAAVGQQQQVVVSPWFFYW